MRRILIVGAAVALLFLATGGALISTGVIGAGSIGATFRGLFAGIGGERRPGSQLSGDAAHGWSDLERGLIASLSIDRLPPLPPDPSNAVGDDPNAVALGHALFFDSGLSPAGTVSCGTCHMPENYFTDGKVRANVRDVDTPRHTPTIVGIAYSDWFYWEGMTEADQGTVNRVFANIGKSIAAFSRKILPGRNRFDDYAAAALANDQVRMAELFSAQEADGLRLFIGDGNCTDCHNGPLFTNGTFHNIGLPLPQGSKFDQGRSQGTLQVVEDEFNCLGEYSDANAKECVELRFIKLEGEELVGAFKVPSLRNVAHTAPYMHNGLFPELDAVIRHYNHAPPAFPGHTDLVPLALTEQQSAALKAFLLTLSAPPNAPPELLRPPVGTE